MEVVVVDKLDEALAFARHQEPDGAGISSGLRLLCRKGFDRNGG
jgi:hypothetical protein